MPLIGEEQVGPHLNFVAKDIQSFTVRPKIRLILELLKDATAGKKTISGQ